MTNARDLLEKSRLGVNPYDGFVPEVPHGERLQTGTDSPYSAVCVDGWMMMISCGLNVLSSVGVMIVLELSFSEEFNSCLQLIGFFGGLP